MQIRTLLIASAALALSFSVSACGKKSSGGSASKSARVDKWLKKPLQSTSGTVSGVAFTVSLPEGLALQKKTHDWKMEWFPKGGDEFDYPHFSIEKSVMFHPTSPEDAVTKYKQDGLNKRNVILKKGTVNGGILLVTRSHHSKAVYVFFYRTAGAKKLHCRGLWIRPSDEDGPIPKLAKVQAWMEKACVTFKTK